jgi:hypothetical protein
MLRQLTFSASIVLTAVNWRSILLLMVLLLAGTKQAVNMLGFPFYDNLEGTNMANAWSVLHEGSLSPYTYNYDNPPMGWILLALWLMMGSFILAPETVFPLGRAFMLIVHVLTVLTMYGVARKLRLDRSFAVLTVLVFSLSPLVTILQRRVLVENMMILWVLVSLYFVLGNGRTLLHYAVSAFALGMAFLTHVAALMFFPAIFYVVLKNSHISHRRFALTFWLGIVFCLSSAFPLQALLKDELLPAGLLFGGSHPHVSLYETQSVQLERVSLQEFLRSDSSFIFNLRRWISPDEAASDIGLIIAGLIGAGFVLADASRSPHLRPLALLLVCYGLHLVTLKRLFDPDIIPLLPLLAISIGIAVQTIAHLAGRHILKRAVRYPAYAVLAILVVSMFGWTYVHKPEPYTTDQVSMQFDAVGWVSQHVPRESFVVTDNYAFVDLRRSIPNVHYYWVVDEDPEVRNEIMDDNWCNIDYLLTTPQMLEDMKNYPLRLVSTAHRNSTSIRAYENDGWPIEVRQVNKHNCNVPFP